MTLEEYQKEAKKTDYQGEISIKSTDFFAIALGLAGETGEILEKLKKIYWHKNGEISQEDKDLLGKELGDLLWYTSSLAGHLGLTLEDVASKNLEKLRDRVKRGVHQGNGDVR